MPDKENKMWVIRSVLGDDGENNVYQVGYYYYDSNGKPKFEHVEVYNMKENAMEQCHYLNGGNV
jgi:hypothetical protein